MLGPHYRHCIQYIKIAGVWHRVKMSRYIVPPIVHMGMTYIQIWLGFDIGPYKNFTNCPSSDASIYFKKLIILLLSTHFCPFFRPFFDILGTGIGPRRTSCGPKETQICLITARRGPENARRGQEKAKQGPGLVQNRPDGPLKTTQCSLWATQGSSWAMQGQQKASL